MVREHLSSPYIPSLAASCSRASQLLTLLLHHSALSLSRNGPINRLPPSLSIHLSDSCSLHLHRTGLRIVSHPCARNKSLARFYTSPTAPSFDCPLISSGSHPAIIAAILLFLLQLPTSSLLLSKPPCRFNISLARSASCNTYCLQTALLARDHRTSRKSRDLAVQHTHTPPLISASSSRNICIRPTRRSRQYFL